MGGALLAGVSGAGKTTLFRRLSAAITASGREIVLTFPQAMTTTCHLRFNDEPKRQATEVLDWCEQLTSFAELVTDKALTGGLTTRRENYPNQWNPMLLLEGAMFDIPLHGFDIRREQCMGLEARLRALEVVLVFLTIPDEMIEERCVRSTREHRGEGWSSHLHALGMDDEARAEHFRSQQAMLAHWVHSSPMETLVLDVTSMSVESQLQAVMDAVNDRAARFLERTTSIRESSK